MRDQARNHIVLDDEEFSLTQNKFSPENHLAFAVMLKFFQVEGRYPTKTDLISKELINSLSIQLNCNIINFRNYNWTSRTAKRFRQEIRAFFNYNEPTEADSEELIKWLIETQLPRAPTLPQCRAYTYQFFRENHLEPFSPKMVNRYVRSAIHQFEKKFLSSIVSQLSAVTIKSFDDFLNDDNAIDEENISVENVEDIEDSGVLIKFQHFKKDLAGVKLKHVDFEIKKLASIRSVSLPTQSFNTTSRKLLQKYYIRIMISSPSNIIEYAPDTRYASMASFCYIRLQILTDNLGDLFIKLIHKMRASAETYVQKKIISEIKRVNGKFDILYLLAETAKENPDGVIQDTIYPKVSKETLEDIVKDLKHKGGGKWYQNQVNTKVHSLYSHAHRKVLIALLDTFSFHSNNPEGKMLLEAIAVIKKNQNIIEKYYPDPESIPVSIISHEWKSLVMEIQEPPQNQNPDEKSKTCHYKINKFNYEAAILETLRTQLRCKSIWIDGAYRYRNPDEDLPMDWDTNREYYYKLLGLPMDAKEFIKTLKESLHKHLQELNDTILSNDKVKILEKNGGHIKITPSEPQAEPTYIAELHREINRRWSTINLIDIVKETDLRINFTQQFHTVVSRESIDKTQLRKRLLLCLYAIGSNAGLKRISSANEDANHSELRYVKRRYIHEVNVKAAIVEVVNEILKIRDPEIWGEATTGVACDSTQVSSWDQNLMNEWHPRYKNRGVMIYWHVDRKSTTIYSQLKTCLSSEVGAMIAGVLKHDTKMNLNKTYMDTHGQSTIGFGFGYCLTFELLPRLKRIHKEKLYYPSKKDKDSYPNLSAILASPISWDTIEPNYDETTKHVAALKTGIVEPDVLIKKFTKDNYSHPVYKTLTEIGNAAKTIFLCRYLMSEELRIEINEALNVVERLNGIMGFIFYGKLGELSTNRTDEQSLSVACLHLLQVCMVYINTLIIQEVLSDPIWDNKLTPEDKRALTPLLHGHINPYGLFPLDLLERLPIEVKKPDDIQDEIIKIHVRKEKKGEIMA
ncbi:MAG: Tn3 family transposase [Parachlamydiaceae bacterium]|nr:Tn3 family transposase [Parachlamydiaceae bacterium]